MCCGEYSSPRKILAVPARIIMLLWAAGAVNAFCILMSGKWKVMNGKWQVASGKWQVASDEWQVTSGKWQLASGK